MIEEETPAGFEKIQTLYGRFKGDMLDRMCLLAENRWEELKKEINPEVVSALQMEVEKLNEKKKVTLKDVAMLSLKKGLEFGKELL